MALILFADDDEMLHPLVGSVLREAGYDLILASEGERACVLAREQAFDLILLDYDMPKLTGIEVLARLKAEIASLPPVIMLTVKGDAETIRECIQAGARDFIVKPFEVAEVLKRIEKHLGAGV